jgi:mycothiol synthase
VNIREATPADAEQVASLCNAVTRELYGEGDASAVEVRSWFEIPGIATALVERDGDVVGYMDVREEEGRVYLDARVAPEARGVGVGAALIARAEEWAREHAPPGSTMRAFASERDTEFREALESAGYDLVRLSYVMEAGLSKEIEEPEFPEGIRVRGYEGGDAEERLVHATIMEAFADHWDFHPTPFETWRPYVFREGVDPSLWWIAMDGDEPAAVSVNQWHLSGDPTFGWIGTLGVRRPWRRRGLARALLLHSFHDFRRRGATRVGLGVDAENTTGAVNLYAGVGMRVVRRNDNYWKTL